MWQGTLSCSEGPTFGKDIAIYQLSSAWITSANVYLFHFFQNIGIGPQSKTSPMWTTDDYFSVSATVCVLHVIIGKAPWSFANHQIKLNEKKYVWVCLSIGQARFIRADGNFTWRKQCLLIRGHCYWFYVLISWLETYFHRNHINIGKYQILTTSLIQVVGKLPKLLYGCIRCVSSV